MLQQKEGIADIALKGIVSVDGGIAGSVYARVVREESGESVSQWTKARTEGENLWKVVLKGIPAGELYRVETGFDANDRADMDGLMHGAMIHHVAVGDLYVIAGQSNSVGYGGDMVCDPPELGISLLRNSCRWDLASHPLNESKDTIHPVNQEYANPGHSPWLLFAKMVKRETDAPGCCSGRRGARRGSWGLACDLRQPRRVHIPHACHVGVAI